MLLMDYLQLELEKRVCKLLMCCVCLRSLQERIVVENDKWLVVVPYW